PAGNYYLRATAQDALGSTAVPKTVGFTIDYSTPEPSDFAIDPLYAKLGATVKISLNFEEELAEAPAVVIYMPDEASRETTLVSSSGNSYEYSYVIGELDAEGNAVVSVTARDLAFNPINKTKEFVVDTTSPEVSKLIVSPSPASTPDVSGQVSIKFNVNEPLKEAPKVYVTQSGAVPQLAIVGGQWTEAGGEVVAKYDVFSGNDGAASISLEITDLAVNKFVYSFSDSLIVDTVKPAFSNIQSEISTNPEFSSYAQEGSVVSVRFEASEGLQFNPEVKINGNLAYYSSLVSNEYTYTYAVTGGDTEGNASISISGFDPAGNEGTAETSSSSESFVIDLVNPTVTIAPPQTSGEYISNPGAFSTNANPDGSDLPRSTMFYYQLAEYSKVTVKVHKVGDSQTTYSKSDFTSSNLIKTLVNDQWQEGGLEQTVPWDGTITNNTSSYDTNNDGYADPGKYAFIVEGRDKAGNLTLKKWGGTVWIQNNVLTLEEPDQLDFDNFGVTPTPEVNPDPHNISPNGNSAELTQKRARFYFMIDLSLNPDSGTVKDPERIEAAAVIADTKAIGKYSVKVYGDIGLTNLVRTVTSDAVAQSATLTWEDWNGKDDNGQFVADGTYYMVVDVKDFAGNPAESNLLMRSVVVDNTVPVVSSLSAAPYYFAPGAGNSNIKTTTLTYEVNDNSSKAKVTIDAYKGTTFVKTLLSDSTWRNNGNYNQAWDGSGPTGFVGTVNGGSFNDGIYTFKVSAIDEAGNSAEVKVKDVVVDTLPPTSGANPGSRDWAKSNISVILNVSDAYSGVKTSQYAWDQITTTPGSGWNNFSNGQTVTQTSDGSWYLHYRDEDNLGNAVSGYFGPYKKDNYPPTVGASPTSRTWATSSISVTLTVNDTKPGANETSGLNTSEYVWSNSTTTPGSGWLPFNNNDVKTQSSEGRWYLHVRATDNQNNATSTYFGPYEKDNSNPSVDATPASRNRDDANISVALSVSDANS
ncbi:MAG: hypothetical protein KJ732_06540, partial [Candidatus Margulisbacteria bacterium]|nr:hypothetical protein [Candidatus Margulisiibacteriota bacterium]